MRCGLPAICVVFLTAGSALAQDTERRQVAVVVLSEDKAVKDKSDEIYAVIGATEGLALPKKRSLDTNLTGDLWDEDKDNLQFGRAGLDDASSLRQVKLDFAGAEKRAREALTHVASVTPTAESRALYADLVLVMGLALLDQHKVQDATSALALVHRLDPTRELDPGRYSPDVQAAYKRAVDSKPELVTVEVKGNGRVWIDFVERSAAPAAFADIEVGEHVVTITGPDRWTRGNPFIVAGPVTITVDDLMMGEEGRVKRARLALSRAQAKHDDVGRANAMRTLAALLGVGDVIMISKRDGKLYWETWKDRAPGFSAPKLYTATTKPEELIEGLAPPRQPKKIVEPKQPTGPKVFKIPDAEVPWYEQRWVQASAVATFAAVIVSGIVWARRTQDLGFNGDIKQAGM